MLLIKYLAHAGLCSRRGALNVVASGGVHINGIITTDPWRDVVETDIVTYKGDSIHLETPVTILLNKPRGYLATANDEHERDTVIDLVKGAITQRVYPVGRLDRATTGLILLTNDGELAQRASHPRYEISKTYHVVLERAIQQSDYAKICAGVLLEDGLLTVDKAVHREDRMPPNHMQLTIHSGKNRVIRRLFEHLGYQVQLLDRIKYAFLTKKGLAPGAWRLLSERDVVALKKQGTL